MKTNKVRADTTVVPANVAYPTDSGLLAKGVAKMAKGIEKLKGAGLASKTTSRDRTQMMRARARSIGANLQQRSGEAKDEVLAINAEMVRIATEGGHRGPTRCRQRPPDTEATGRSCSGKALRSLPATSSSLLIGSHRLPSRPRSDSVVTIPDGATRSVSLHDPDARPIRKGRLGKPVEFGYKAQVVVNEDGVVIDHNVENRNSLIFF